MMLSREACFMADKEQQIILEAMATATQKLWNVGNYEKHNYVELGMDYPHWYDQNKRLKTHYWFRALPSQSAQRVLKELEEAWKSYYVLKETGGVENPRPPRYKYVGSSIPFSGTSGVKKEADGVFRFTISKQERIFLKDKHELEVKFLRVRLPWFENLTNVKEVAIYPMGGNEWKAIAVYEVREADALPDNGRYFSIDLGVRNFATCCTSDGQSFILGKRFLEYNHYYNKKIAHYQSISDSQQVAMGVQYPKKSKRVLGLYKSYKNTIDDLLHKTSAWIKDYCVTNNINTVIIGDITGIRDGNNLGARNNQAFHALPYRQFCEKLEYKLKLVGIELRYQNEAYSSQVSPLKPKVNERNATPTKRVKRGLYKDKNFIFNADVVGAYNIMRLAVPKGKFQFPKQAPIKVSV